MSKLIRLSKSGIEYLNYSWGAYSGCHNIEKDICKVKACWARRIALHYKDKFPNGFDPTFYSEALQSPLHIKKPSIIGVGWVGDIIGYGQEYLPHIFEVIKKCPQHSFVFLTKNGTELCHIDFPPNCWVGITATDQNSHNEAIVCLDNTKAKVKFVSYEPLISEIVADKAYSLDNINWVVIGAQTHPNINPKLNWVLDLVEEADRLNKAIFLKNNLLPLLTEFGEANTCAKQESRVLNTLFSDNKLRQEFPRIER